MARKSFIIYSSWEKSIDKLSPEEQVLFLKRLFDAYNGRELTPIPSDMIRLDMFWDTIKYLVDSNIEKYEAQVERANKAREEKANIREENSNLRDSNSKVSFQPSLSKVSNDNVNAKVNGNGNAKANGNEEAKVGVEELKKELIEKGLYNPTNKIPSSFKEEIEYLNFLNQ